MIGWRDKNICLGPPKSFYQCSINILLIMMCFSIRAALHIFFFLLISHFHVIYVFKLNVVLCIFIILYCERSTHMRMRPSVCLYINKFVRPIEHNIISVHILVTSETKRFSIGGVLTEHTQKKTTTKKSDLVIETNNNKVNIAHQHESTHKPNINTYIHKNSLQMNGDDATK